MNKSLKAFIIRAILAMAPFVFIACEKSTGEIGLDQVIDDKAALGIKKGLPVIAFSIPFDSIATKSPSQEIAGSYIDPIFGGVKASFSTHLLLSLLNPDFGEQPICDSVVFYVAYKGYYGDTSAPVTFVLHELGEYLDPDTSYYSTKKFAKGKELGRVTTVPKPNTSAYDEGTKLAPALRINLDKNYFQEKVINASRLSKQYFINNLEFIKHLHGIQLSTEGYASGLTYFDISSLSSFVKVYYRESPADTVSERYEMYFGVYSSGNFVSVNSFEQDFSLATFNLNAQDTVMGESTIYAQAMGGAVSRIYLPNLRQMADSGWVFNRAELVIPVREGTVGRYPLPASLLLVEDRGDKKPLVDDYKSGGLGAGGNVEYGQLRDKKYTFNITQLVNRLVYSTDTIYPLIILPASSASQGWRAVLNGNTDPIEPLKFNIYYTKTKK